MVKVNKSKKEIPTEVGPALNPAKKSRVSALGEEKESSPRQAQKEPKVYLIEHGCDESPKNWDFGNEVGEYSDDDDEDSRLKKRQNIEKQRVFMMNWAKTCSARIRGQLNITQPFHSYG